MIEECRSRVLHTISDLNTTTMMSVGWWLYNLDGDYRQFFIDDVKSKVYKYIDIAELSQ